MNNKSSIREFSDNQHARQKWNTRTVSPAFSIFRPFIEYLSFKRQNVSLLMRLLPARSLVLDAGAGTGSYSAYVADSLETSTVVSLDWSVVALQADAARRQRRILKVVGDVTCLPFKQSVFDGYFTIDTLGHCQHPLKALDEAGRVTKSGAHLFIHSECRNPVLRWPDKSLIKKLGKDVVSEADGHIGAFWADELYQQLSQRFKIEWFGSPAGLLGWILGYPEKYLPAFSAAKMHLCTACTAVFSVIKKIPVLGLSLRLVNITINRLELFLGISGGGSGFARLKKYE